MALICWVFRQGKVCNKTMDKDFRYKNSNANRNVKKRWFLLLIALISVGGGAGFLFYEYTHQQSVLAPFFARINTWIVDHKTNLQKGLAAKGIIKSNAVSKQDTESQIHFEFYNALPNMQVNVAMAVADDARVSSKSKSFANSPNKATMNREDNDEAAGVSASHSSDNKMAESPAKSTVNIVNADELEQELSKHIKQMNYFVQLGLFRNKSMANRYRDTIINAGFTANVVKTVITDKTFFRVQLGPFANKSEAKITQQQLQKKGVNAMLRAVVDG